MSERGLRDSEDLRTPVLSRCMRGGERLATDKRQSSVNGAEKRSLHAAPLLSPLGRGRKRKADFCLTMEKQMARPRDRVCLQDGLKLDLLRLAQKGFIQRGANIGVRGISWTHSYWGEVASGLISAEMAGDNEGWLRIQIGNLDQRIILVPRPRRFGGHQWYFICPVLNRKVSVLWKPPGATQFCCRQTWGRRVAYQSQFNDATNRAHLGQARIKSRLIADLDPDDWDLPPKPKWMRWKTYERHTERFDRNEAELDYGCTVLAAKLSGLKLF